MFGITGLTPDIFLVLCIITMTIILFLIEIVRVDVVALLVLVLLGLTKLVPSHILFSGFSSEAVIALIGIMILSAGLERTGIVAKMSYFIMRVGGDNENRLRTTLMGVGGFCAGFLRSVGTVAIFLPVVTRIRQAVGLPKSRLLMPLGFAAILGSTLTMLGTGPLILLNSLLSAMGGLTEVNGVSNQLRLFSVFPIGSVLLLVGILYFWVFNPWILPPIDSKSWKSNGGSPNYFKRIYGIGADFCECRVPATSSLVNNTVKEWEWLLPPSVAILGIKTGSNLQIPPSRKKVVKTGCVLAMLGPKEEIAAFCKKHGLRMSPYLTAFAEHLNPTHAGLCEAVVPPSSQLIGTDLGDIHMRRQYGIQVLAVHRGTKVSRGKREMGDLSLRAGDTLGMFCEWGALSQLEKNPDFVVVTSDFPKQKLHSGKMGLALFFFILSIGLIVAGLSVAIGLLVGAVGMMFSGVIRMDDAYEAVSWKTVFLIAGLIPLGIAVQMTGTSDWIAEYILRFYSHSSYWSLLLLLGVLASVGGLVLSNVGATIVLVPLAVNLAQTVGADPRAFGLMVAVAASNSFILPTHQANALINLPGQYKVSDFFKAGGVMSLLFLLIVTVMIRWMF